MTEIGTAKIRIETMKEEIVVEIENPGIRIDDPTAAQEAAVGSDAAARKKVLN